MEKRKKKNGFQWLNEVSKEPYYLSHFIVFFSYIIVRCSSNSVSPSITGHLLHREIQAVMAFLVLAVVKIVREETWEGVIADILFYAKIFLVPVTLILDYHLTLWYMLCFSVMYIITQQPAFEGLGTASKLTPLQLETMLTEGNTSRFWLIQLPIEELELLSLQVIPRTDEPIYVFPSIKLSTLSTYVLAARNSLFDTVEFLASCSSPCIRTSRCFSELAITYSTKMLNFGIVDLGLFPNAAEKFGISLESIGQLPVYILFENATEVARYPEKDFESKAPHPAPITKRLLSRHFELDRLLLQYVNGK